VFFGNRKKKVRTEKRGGKGQKKREARGREVLKGKKWKEVRKADLSRKKEEREERITSATFFKDSAPNSDAR